MGVYQIFKLFVTPAIVILEYTLDGQTLSTRRALCLGLVCLFCVGSIHGDLQISTQGLMWATIWVPFAAIFKVQWARMKKRYDCSTLNLMNAAMPYACILQLAIAPIVDPPGLFKYQWTLEAGMLLTMSAFGAFFVLYSSFLVLGHVGPLSHTLLGPLKTTTTMMGSAILFKTQYSKTQLVTAAGALISLAAYTHVTMTEKRRTNKEDGSLLPPRSTSSLSLNDTSCLPIIHENSGKGDDDTTVTAFTLSMTEEDGTQLDDDVERTPLIEVSLPKGHRHEQTMK